METMAEPVPELVMNSVGDPSTALTWVTGSSL